MVEILRSRDQTGPLWWRFSSAIVALYSLMTNNDFYGAVRCLKELLISCIRKSSLKI